MWGHILVYSGVVALGQTLDKLISKGKWVAEAIERCPNSESYLYDIDIHKKKVNRTHDGFNVDLNFNEALTEDGFGILIEACKKVDGGCRPVIMFEDESFCRFLMKNAEKNVKEVLRLIGVEENCPVPQGSYKLIDYTFDNRELPDEGMVGRFMATITVPRVSTKEKMACFIVHVHFDEDDDWF